MAIEDPIAVFISRKVMFYAKFNFNGLTYLEYSKRLKQKRLPLKTATFRLLEKAQLVIK